MLSMLRRIVTAPVMHQRTGGYDLADMAVTDFQHDSMHKLTTVADTYTTHGFN